jgi:hypothetical protein
VVIRARLVRVINPSIYGTGRRSVSPAAAAVKEVDIGSSKVSNLFGLELFLLEAISISSG